LIRTFDRTLHRPIGAPDRYAAGRPLRLDADYARAHEERIQAFIAREQSRGTTLPAGMRKLAWHWHQRDARLFAPRSPASRKSPFSFGVAFAVHGNPHALCTPAVRSARERWSTEARLLLERGCAFHGWPVATFWFGLTSGTVSRCFRDARARSGLRIRLFSDFDRDDLWQAVLRGRRVAELLGGGQIPPAPPPGVAPPIDPDQEMPDVL
jgi:hypothetical protein